MLASNGVSVPIDSAVMTMIAFYGVMSGREMVEIIFADILAKYLIASTILIRPETLSRVRSILCNSSTSVKKEQGI